MSDGVRIETGPRIGSPSTPALNFLSLRLVPYAIDPENFRRKLSGIFTVILFIDRTYNLLTWTRLGINSTVLSEIAQMRLLLCLLFSFRVDIGLADDVYTVFTTGRHCYGVSVCPAIRPSHSCMAS